MAAGSSGSTPGSGPGSSPAPRRFQRIRVWARGHGPQTLFGASFVAVLAAVAAALVTGMFESGGRGGGGGTAAPGPGGQPVKECRGAGCHGLKPDTADCGADAELLAHQAEPVHLELKYSPKCRAAWAKITEAGVGDQVVITPAVGTATKAVITSHHDNHTEMVPADGEFELQACAVPDDGDGTPRWQRFCVKATDEDAK